MTSNKPMQRNARKRRLRVPSARRAFYISYMNAPPQRDFLLARDLNGAKTNWKDITHTGELIMKTFDLLTISGIEKEIPVPEIGNALPNQVAVSDAANDVVPHTL
jgi:hypothetical protein